MHWNNYTTAELITAWVAFCIYVSITIGGWHIGYINGVRAGIDKCGAVYPTEPICSGEWPCLED